MAKVCIEAPVGRILDRRRLRAVAIMLLDYLIRHDPMHAEALCMKGELLLPSIHYGANDFDAPREVLREAYQLFDRASKVSSVALFLKGRWLLSMAFLHKNEDDTKRGAALVKEAVKKNCPRAMTFLANRYEYPEMDANSTFHDQIPRGRSNKEKYIFRYYKKAAELGNSDALNDIGSSYAEGYGGLEPDFDKAIDYYQKAIQAGSVLGYDNLGTHYETGMNGQCPDRKNPEKALEYYRRGAKQRCAKAAANLGAVYQDGMKGLVVRNIRKAEKYYMLALKIADDNQEYLHASRCLRDLVAVLLTRLKLVVPGTAEERKVRKKIMRVIRDEDTVDTLLTKLNKNCLSAARGRRHYLETMLDEENARPIIEKMTHLQEKMRATTATAEEVLMFNHIIGYHEDAEVEVAAAPKKRKAKTTSSVKRLSKRKRRA